MWNAFPLMLPGPDHIRLLPLLDLSVCFIAKKKLVSLYCLQTSRSKLRRAGKACARVHTLSGFLDSSRSCKDTAGSGPLNQPHPTISQAKDSQAPGAARRRRIKAENSFISSGFFFDDAVGIWGLASGMFARFCPRFYERCEREGGNLEENPGLGMKVEGGTADGKTNNQAVSAF